MARKTKTTAPVETTTAAPPAAPALPKLTRKDRTFLAMVFSPDADSLLADLMERGIVEHRGENNGSAPVTRLTDLGYRAWTLTPPTTTRTRKDPSAPKAPGKLETMVNMCLRDGGATYGELLDFCGWERCRNSVKRAIETRGHRLEKIGNSGRDQIFVAHRAAEPATAQ